MADRLTLTPQQVSLLRKRYTRILEQLLPVAYQHYQGINSPALAAAIEALQPYSDAMINLFRVLLEQGRYEPDESETRQLIVILLAIGQYLSQRGLWAESVRWGTALLDRAEQHQWVYEPALLTFLSNVHHASSDPQTTFHYIQRALASPLLQSDRQIEALLLVSLSQTLFRVGQYQSTVNFALQAVEIPLDPPQPGLLADAWMEASNALMALGQHQEALDCAQQAYQHALTLGENDLLRLASTSAVLALAYTANGYLQEAHPLYQAAITFYDHIGDEPNAAHTRIMLATLAFRNRERDQAITLIEIAIQVYERYGIEHSLHEARALLDLLQGRS